VNCQSGLERPVPWSYFLCAGAGAVGAPLLFAYWKSREPHLSVAGWVAIILLGLVAQFRFGLYCSGEKDWLLLAGPRMAPDARSPAIEKIKKDQTSPFRVVGLQYNLYGDYEAVYGLEDIRSCAPLTGGEFMDLIQKFPGIKFDYGWIVEVKNPVAAQPLLNLLNVKYLLTMPGVMLPSGLAFHITDQSDFAVVENLEAWPRAFFTDRVFPNATTSNFIQLLVHQGQRPFAALAPREIATQPGLWELAASQTAVVLAATNYQLLPNSTAFDVHAPSAGVVCLSEGQARDFSATANGESKKVLTVNRAFKGIYLDRPGTYHVQFTFRPRHWRLACWLFFAATLTVITLAGLRALQIHRESHHFGTPVAHIF